MTRVGAWATGFRAVTDGSASGADIFTFAEAAEEAGFDSLWINDLELGPTSNPGPVGAGESAGDGSMVDAYSLLGALAVRTRSIRLGVLPGSRQSRAPSILSKIVTSIDVISHGRGVIALGLDAGDNGTSIDRLAESLQVCRAVLEEDVPRFAGTFHTIEGAINRPRPVQRGGIPLVVVASRSQPPSSDLLTVASRYADALIVGGEVPIVENIISVVRAASSDSGRDPHSVQVIWCDYQEMEPTHPATRNRGWIGSRPVELAEAVEARLEVGAVGCIVPITGPAERDAIVPYGSALRDVVDAWRAEDLPSRTPD